LVGPAVDEEPIADVRLYHGFGGLRGQLQKKTSRFLGANGKAPVVGQCRVGYNPPRQFVYDAQERA
jgi:hypothetical protein